MMDLWCVYGTYTLNLGVGAGKLQREKNNISSLEIVIELKTSNCSQQQKSVLPF